MGKASRAKGRRCQTEGAALLVGAGWTCVDTSAGDAVEDVFAIDRVGDTWAVEVTADQGISFAAKWGQAQRQADARGDRVRPLMLWKVDRAGWWLAMLTADAEPMRARALELELRPPARISFVSTARKLDELRPALELDAGAMPVIRTAGHVAAPAELALTRWWS